MSYQIIISRTARKHLNGLPEHVRARVTREIEALRDDPRPVGNLKLKGYKTNTESASETTAYGIELTTPPLRLR